MYVTVVVTYSKGRNTGSANESGDLATAFLYFWLERGRVMMLPDGVAVNSIQFEMESWTGSQRAFAAK